MTAEQPAIPDGDTWVTPEDVAREMNFIEDLISDIGGTDEYLDAILENQRLTAMAIQSVSQQGLTRPPSDTVATTEDGSPAGFPDVSVRPVPGDAMVSDRVLPVGAVGVASSDIFGNGIGLATFQIQGTVFADNARATEDISSGSPVVVVAPGNIIEPAEGVSTNLLGFGGGVSSNRFNIVETDENVTIQPGEQERVVQVSADSPRWVFTGTNDETYSLYHYLVDGNEVFEQPLKEPLGLYNDPYDFPTPIKANRQFTIEVERTQDAPGSAEYFSKVAYLGE